MEKAEAVREKVTSAALLAAAETQRSLASIQRVESVEKHSNADSLELVTLEDKGWQIVTRIGEVKSGDIVIYCEIDSLLPGDADWLPEAIKQRVESQTNKEWFRVKTVKLRKELSQGLIIPLSNFETLSVNLLDKNIDDNVTQLLSIGKYEPNSGENGGGGGGGGTPKVSTFPSHLIDKTDETRIQSHTKWIKEMQGKGYYAAVKCDGMSGSFLLNGGKDGEFLVCSRNQIRSTVTDGNIPENDAYTLVAKKYAIEEKLRTPEYENYAIQGEVCGPKIQKNLLNLPDIDFFVFNIIDIKHRQRVPLDRMIEICRELKLKHVDIVESRCKFDLDKTFKELGIVEKDLLTKLNEKFRVKFKLESLTDYPTPNLLSKLFRKYVMEGIMTEEMMLEMVVELCVICKELCGFRYSSVPELLKLSEGKYKNTKNHREGIVVRSFDGKISFKVINNQYLLKNDY